MDMCGISETYNQIVSPTPTPTPPFRDCRQIFSTPSKSSQASQNMCMCFS